ncbi:MAG TPA: hypothetical protein VGG85_05995 [Terracidiphilus sp.]
MHFTIERLRTLVLVLGALLVVALVAFLAIGRWRSHFNLREIPKRLGVDIQQEANGVTYTQARGGHTLFKIHASKVVQLKQGGRALLHDVQIELYGEDGSRVDRIAGDEFEYDQKQGTATAAGPVEITLMRPGIAPVVAPRATPAHAAGDKDKGGALANAAHTASEGEMHVKTSGLTFDQKSGIATTAQRVEFEITQGTGSSVGANFDSDKGQLVLDHAVQLDIKRGTESVRVHAQHAEFERGDLLCRLQAATASFRGGDASAGGATIQFREDGSAVWLNASNGFALTTKTASHLAAPRATLEFDEHNRPRRARLEGGTTMDSSANGRQVHGAAPTALLDFTQQGDLRHAHLERGVTMHSEESITARDGEVTQVSRDWRSPLADVEFRTPQPAGRGQVELASVHGMGGVNLSGESRHGMGPVLPSGMGADDLKAAFAAGQVLTQLVGTGHASLEQTTAAGAKQTTSGDRIEANFVVPAKGAEKPGTAATSAPRGEGSQRSAAAQIQSATFDGNVVLVQQPASKPGSAPVAILRATAGHAAYEGEGEWLHLTNNPRVEDGGLQLTAERIDVSQGSGDAFAHGNVKATWSDEGAGKAALQGKVGLAEGNMGLGGQGPAHVIAAEAQLHQATGEATFRGQARLWQQANSISAPVIVLDRNRQILTAHATSKAEPVSLTLLSAGSATGAPGVNKQGGSKASGKAPSAPSVIRITAGDLKYSDAERKGVMHGGAAGNVIAETGATTSVSNELNLVLLPAGNHAAKDGGSAQVDRMTASGRVSIVSQGRRGLGERLEYSSESGDYVLTGTAAVPPKLVDPARGTVTGESLIFNSRDDSVSIEGNGRKTATETTAPK